MKLVACNNNHSHTWPPIVHSNDWNSAMGPSTCKRISKLVIAERCPNRGVKPGHCPRLDNNQSRTNSARLTVSCRIHDALYEPVSTIAGIFYSARVKLVITCFTLEELRSWVDENRSTLWLRNDSAHYGRWISTWGRNVFQLGFSFVKVSFGMATDQPSWWYKILKILKVANFELIFLFSFCFLDWYSTILSFYYQTKEKKEY